MLIGKENFDDEGNQEGYSGKANIDNQEFLSISKNIQAYARNDSISSNLEEEDNFMTEGGESINDEANSESEKISTVLIRGVPIASISIGGKQRLCLAQISSTLLKRYSYNEIHNRCAD